MVTTRHNNAMRVAAVDRRAASLGLKAGLALADARARVPDIDAHEHQPEADQVLLTHVADWCDRYTPVVAEDLPDGLTLEISGSAHLFGGEAALMADLRSRLKGFGLSVRTVIASTTDCARTLARFGGQGLVARGEEKRACASLPVGALQLDQDRMVALRRAGLARIADLAERPRKPLAARFGVDMIERLSGILGEVDRPLSPRRPIPEFSAEQRFADPIGLAEDIAAAFDALSRDLCETLEKYGKGGRRFEAVFFRADGATRRIQALSGRPLRDRTALKRLFTTRLEALADPLDPGFGFDMIRLSAFGMEEAAPAQVHFEREHAEEEAVADLIDRLTARYGPAAVECFLPEESHVPERAARHVPAISAMPWKSGWPEALPGEPPLRPLLMLCPAQPVETVAMVPDGPPLRFRWRRVLHEIARAEGPERIAPEWWRKEPGQTRDYYRVEDTQGHRFWLFRCGLYGREAGEIRWYIHGLFA